MNILLFLLLAISLFGCSSRHALAQSGSFLDQKRAQKKLTLEQILLYKVLGQLNQNGYAATDRQLRETSAIEAAESEMHQRYFHSLTRPSAAIDELPQLENIYTCLARIRQTITAVGSEIAFRGYEPAYVSANLRRLIGDLSVDLEVIKLALAAGHANMSDDSRIRRINECEQAVMAHLSRAQKLLSSVHKTRSAKAKQNREITTMRRLYALP